MTTRKTATRQWKYKPAYRADTGALTISREPVAPDGRSDRHRLLADLLSDGKALQGVTVKVTAIFSNGAEAAYEIGYTSTLSTGLQGNRDKLSDALLAALGTHESGQLWKITWDPDEPKIKISLRMPLGTMLMHHLRVPAFELPVPQLDHRGIAERQQMDWPTSDPKRMGKRLHIPFASCETDNGTVDAYWNVSDDSASPHMLVVGPTGGGKTVLLTTVITELVLRGVPVIGVDPKRIELHQFLGYPGVPAVVFDPIRAAYLIYALWKEMHDRTKYMQVNRLSARTMPPLVVILDEFFILSAAWSQLKASGTDQEKEAIKFTNPLGRIGELVALARSAGIRLAVGVQRPDAHLFGKDSGSVRDNFQTRAALARLSADGAYMMWGDGSVGNDIDKNIRGRATVSAPSGDPALAQVWFTPTIDDHPAARSGLSKDELSAVESLRPVRDTPVYCFSAELPAFIGEEQQLIDSMADDVREPVAVTGTSSVSSIVDQIDDALPALALTKGMEIVYDLSDPDARGTVLSVETVRPVIRSKEGAITDEGLVKVQVSVESVGKHTEVVVLDCSGTDTFFLASVDLGATRGAHDD